jgi:hypothetical protein
MKRIRQLHLYLGTLFAPAIIFFALTGALQTFDLHEGPGAPAWIAELSLIHKKQTATPPRRPPAKAETSNSEGEKRPAPPGAAATTPEKSPPLHRPSPLPLKIFVLLMAIGLISTTLLGIYMSFKYNRDRRVVWALLIAGIVLPIILLFV